MSVRSPDAVTEAQSNQIPPALRRFAQTECYGVTGVERCRHEKRSRGFKITAERVPARNLPDGYELSSAMVVSDGLVAQIREE